MCWLYENSWDIKGFSFFQSFIDPVFHAFALEINICFPGLFDLQLSFFCVFFLFFLWFGILMLLFSENSGTSKCFFLLVSMVKNKAGQIHILVFLIVIL